MTADPIASPVDETAYRRTLGRLPTGVVAVTALAGGAPAGLAVNSFTSVSLDPPLVAFCVAHTSVTWPRILPARRLCVNILSADQREVARRLASRGGDKFGGLRWSPSPSGLPILDGALAWLECEIDTSHLAGDHDIVVARVHRLKRGNGDTGPLIFYRGGYGGFAPSTETNS